MNCARRGRPGIGVTGSTRHFSALMGPIVNPIAVARDQIVPTLVEPASDLWSIDLPAP